MTMSIWLEVQSEAGYCRLRKFERSLNRLIACCGAQSWAKSCLVAANALQLDSLVKVTPPAELICWNIVISGAGKTGAVVAGLALAGPTPPVEHPSLRPCSATPSPSSSSSKS